MLERLAGRIRVAQVLVFEGRLGWVGPSCRQIDELLDRLRVLDLARALEVRAAVEHLGVIGEPSLDQLVDAVPASLGVVLKRHSSRLRRDIREVGDRSRDLVEALEGAAGSGGDIEVTLDAIIRQGAMRVARRGLPPSFVDFVLGPSTRR